MMKRLALLGFVCAAGCAGGESSGRDPGEPRLSFTVPNDPAATFPAGAFLVSAERVRDGRIHHDAAFEGAVTFAAVKLSGTGTVSGALSRDAVDGYALFDDLVFDSPGAWQITVTAQDHSQATTTLDVGRFGVLAPAGALTHRELVMAPSDTERLYSIAAAGAATPGLHVSDDGGATWVLTSLIDFGLAAPVVDPSNPDRVFVSVGDAANPLAPLAVSANAGATWARAALPMGVTYGSPVELDGTRAYLAVQSPLTILRSDDTGDTWSPAAAAPPDVPRELSAVGDVVYARWEGAVYRSTDAGDAWASTGFAAAAGATALPISIAVDPADSDRVVAVVNDPFVWETSFFRRYEWTLADGWAETSEWLPGRAGMEFLGDGVLLQGTGHLDPFDLSEAPVSVSLDGGTTWSDVIGAQAFATSPDLCRAVAYTGTGLRATRTGLAPGACD